ncbi:MAG TPA: glycine cleavage system aminomethyltransferase GcvT [Pirellulaceae bacterium]|nr:glycine cleavage system aminomethyltransferase GcvT [Pirellulaceae bacterium]
MTAALLETPLHAWHAQRGGRMVDFAGWSMPVQYSSIIEEHHAVRRAAGLFDVSHMGRFDFVGSDAREALEGLLTRRVADMTPGQVRYSLVTDETGGTLDDILVSCVSDDEFALVVNASNREKLWKWFAERTAGDSLERIDRTLETAMIAVQGPKVAALTQSAFGFALDSLKRYTFRVADWNGHRVIVSRTGYTGEDGFEAILPSEIAVELWNALLESDAGAKACGLGARDTLRLEAGMPLYGHELDETITPIEAGLKFAVTLGGRKFPGAGVLGKQLAEGTSRVRVGAVLAGKRAARQHYPVLSCPPPAGDGQPIGETTSGTYSPTLERSIAMAYVPPRFAAAGTPLEFDLRGKLEAATVATLPFYRRSEG